MYIRRTEVVRSTDREVFESALDNMIAKLQDKGYFNLEIQYSTSGDWMSALIIARSNNNS